MAINCDSGKTPVRVFLGNDKFFYLDQDHYHAFDKMYRKAKSQEDSTMTYERIVFTMEQATDIISIAREHFGAPNDPVGFLAAD